MAHHTLVLLVSFMIVYNHCFYFLPFCVSTTFLTEDELVDMIRTSKPVKFPERPEEKYYGKGRDLTGEELSSET